MMPILTKKLKLQISRGRRDASLHHWVVSSILFLCLCSGPHDYCGRDCSQTYRLRFIHTHIVTNKTERRLRYIQKHQGCVEILHRRWVGNFEREWHQVIYIKLCFTLHYFILTHNYLILNDNKFFHIWNIFMIF